jgi:hypothetical protein
MSVVPIAVRPKTETRYHNGQHYHLTFDPNALDGKNWVWRAVITKTYTFVGDASTIEAAARGAKKSIDKFVRVYGDKDAG